MNWEKQMDTQYQEIEKAIHRSQHCQRNWDLNREIPEDDLNLILTAATECPSKQNIAHYNLHVITNRDLIEKIHSHTVGFRGTQTNSQVLANVLIVMEQKEVIDHKNLFGFVNISNDEKKESFSRDACMAVGVAAGYINIVSSMLGYSTGCCACFDSVGVKEALGIEGDVLLMMGIGFKNHELSRRVHHNDHNFVFPTIKKEKISVKHYN